MSDISREYLVLFSAITQAEQTLESLRARLVAAQQLAEELYLRREDAA